LYHCVLASIIQEEETYEKPRIILQKLQFDNPGTNIKKLFNSIDHIQKISVITDTVHIPLTTWMFLETEYGKNVNINPSKSH
jgi:hypothetical protein